MRLGSLYLLLFKAQAAQLWRLAVRVSKEGRRGQSGGVSPNTVDREDKTVAWEGEEMIQLAKRVGDALYDSGLLCI